jgi:hypothetical protein
VGNHSVAITTDPFVVVGRKGSAGKPTYAAKGGWVIDTAYFAQPRDTDEVDCKFLFYAISSLDFSDDIIATAIPGINRTAIGSHSIPVPPLAIQAAAIRLLDAASVRAVAECPQLPEPLSGVRRIVARIEELAAKIEVARGLRTAAKVETNALEAAEATAVFAELDKVVHVPIRILGRDGANPVQTGPFGAQLHASEFVTDGVPVLNVGNVTPAGLDTRKLDFVTSEKAAGLSRYSVAVRDLLFARSGATLGKVCLVPPGSDGWLMSGHLFRVRFDEQQCDPEFALAGLRAARSVREQVFEQVRGATRPGFNTKLLSNVCLPLPPLTEQMRIVAQLDGLRAKVDALKRLQAETAVELDALLPSILDKAFKGEL